MTILELRGSNDHRGLHMPLYKQDHRLRDRGAGQGQRIDADRMVIRGLGRTELVRVESASGDEPGYAAFSAI
jgi:hypothetical protein